MNVDMQKMIGDANNRQQDANAKEHFEKMIEFNSRTFDKAAQYNNFVVSLAFGSFLAIWIWAREFLNASDSKLTITLLGFALIGFVLWNLMESFRISLMNIKAAKILSAEDKTAQRILSDYAEFERSNEKSNLKYLAGWYVVFLITLLAGSLSGILLLSMIFLSFLGVDFSIGDFLLAIPGN